MITHSASSRYAQEIHRLVQELKTAGAMSPTDRAVRYGPDGIRRLVYELEELASEAIAAGRDTARADSASESDYLAATDALNSRVLSASARLSFALIDAYDAFTALKVESTGAWLVADLAHALHIVYDLDVPTAIARAKSIQRWLATATHEQPLTSAE